MQPSQDIQVNRSTSIRQALSQLDKTGSGILLLLDPQGLFERTVTDGDLRRLILAGHGVETPLSVLPTIQSVTLKPGHTRRDALNLMNQHVLNHVPVVDGQGRVLEVLDRRTVDELVWLSSPHMGRHELEFVEEAFRTNWIAPLGPNVDAFEKELAEWVGVGHAAAVSSGTAALHLALRMLGTGPGDWVFCSSLTFAASANPIVYQGARPVFIDSDEVSWNMSPKALEKAFDWAKKQGQMPKAVIVVNLYGQSADMDALLALCEAHGVPVVEDAAESLGARYKGKSSGTFGRMGVFSFNGNKIITTSGGGMLVSDDQVLIEQARFLATQARDPAPHYEHTQIGYNYRMSNILAGVGRGQLRELQSRVDARRRVFETYRAELSDIEALAWMPEPEWSHSTHWLTACTIEPSKTKVTVDALLKALSAEMIEARPLWKPMHLQPVFADCPFFSHDSFAVSDRLFAQGVCLPSGSNMSESTQMRVIQQLRSIFLR